MQENAVEVEREDPTAEGTPIQEHLRTLPTWVPATLAVTMTAVALLSLHRELVDLTWVGVRKDLSQISLSAAGLALLLTAVNYVVLTAYDGLGLRYAGVKLARGRIALAATVGYAFSQGLGFPLLTGTSVRYRLYSRWGLSGTQIGRVVAFYTSTFWIGFAAMAGTAFLLAPVPPPSFVALPSGSLRLVGVGLLALVGVYATWSISGRGSLRVGRFSFPVPTPGLVSLQLLVAICDWLVAGLVLWVILPDGHALGFGAFMSVYLLAQCAGIISHVPGGLGVFEAVFISFLPVGPQHPKVLASLLVFRLIYYVAPLFLAACALAVHEARSHRDTLAPRAARAASVVSQLVPTAAAGLVFVLGAVLLFTGSIPFSPGKLQLLEELLPLPVLELSHFLGSLVGVGLLLLARGLERRLDGAFQVALVFLVLGGALSLARDLPPAGVLAFASAAIILFAARREFYRPASLLDEPFSGSWTLAIAAVMGTALWLGFFAFKHVEYSSELWWRFAANDDAPRFLRATVGAAVGLAVFGLARLLRTAPPTPSTSADPDALRLVAPIVEASPNTDANLVYLGDKQVLLSDSGTSFLMYAVSGSSWVVMGDPVGEAGDFEGLIWKLREMADRAGGRIVFYEVGAMCLPLYIDQGLVFYKLGEVARVPLAGFTLEGKARAELRQASRRLEREGGTFEVVLPDQLPPLLPRLRQVSDEWLSAKSAREKGFSLGSFEEEYVSRFPVALIRVQGEIVAFANLWPSTSKEELSVDLMRYSEAAPNGVMTALFTHLFLWGAQQDYRWFSLGMAPFSGMETHRLAPAWQKMGSALFRYGEHFYNFQGLREYKEKFEPVWEPRYLAAPSGIGVAVVLADITTLISGGLRGAIMH